ncbi:holo-ACP synthase [Cohnella nanjingensis]|uniref:Holo-[acyl-carrier-protein] synthase n=1 Tax=Cohnella nanjingensis TaxID=1387779 RepID=A0A7X0RVS8_9BACL|nr:holo-ACP synthase [Cohnella nanjingensis]MBB6673275.1 holo-ACP synthase [Cohnella nanjingensis]
MIIGIGLDVVEMERMARLLAGDTGRKFAERVLTAAELVHYAGMQPRRAVEFAAGRFAAKEAVVKAFGCGIGATVGFRDIELLPDPSGRPMCRLGADAWERLGLPEAGHSIHVAITHERKLAAATAIVETVNAG